MSEISVTFDIFCIFFISLYLVLSLITTSNVHIHRRTKRSNASSTAAYNAVHCGSQGRYRRGKVAPPLCSYLASNFLFTSSETIYVTPANIHTNLILQESRLIELHFAADSLCLSSFKFKTLLFRRGGCSRCTRSPMLGVSQHMDPKLFGREIIFEEFERIWTRYLNVTDGRTYRRTRQRSSH